MRKHMMLLFAALTLVATAQNKSTVDILGGEKWYGAATALGSRMPLENVARMSLSVDNMNNQTAPFLVSNLGRYIYSRSPFVFEIKDNKIVIDSPGERVDVVRAGKNLREAFALARNKHFAGSGKIPDKSFFEVAQWNTWIELMYNQNQGDIENYADQIIAAGFEPGIIMIDDNWQRYYGNFEFKAEKFTDPRAMVERLHRQGFKVMLWVCPFVSADSPEFRELSKKGFLIKKKGTVQAAVIQWWNGYSGCYDLTNPEAYRYLVGQLKEVQSKYGVDGFKFDAGDPHFYNPAEQDFYRADALATDHTLAWAKLGLEFPYNEYRACWMMQGEPLVQRLGDKNYSWGALKLLIPEMLNAGLMGYAYTCPDMIGGGQFSSFLNVTPANIDQTLIVRSAQLHALMPMMQFSVAPWRVLDKEHLRYCAQAANLHKKFAPYILELAQESARTGEPIVRSMEYMFPHKGFSDCTDQFMLGAKYLVAPIMSADGKRTVRLPQGVWLDDLGRKHRGPLVLELHAPLDRLPYFEKSESVITSTIKKITTKKKK